MDLIQLYSYPDIEDGEIEDETCIINKNTRIIGVICWNERGYTITNGVVHISRLDGQKLYEDLRTLMIDRLFVVEEFGIIHFERLIKLPPLPDSFPPCPFCNRIDCHMWKVMEGGYQKLVKFKIHPIEH
ncbi:hypothetical protein AVEN_122687-1 [Araneus ventricosus]|uniref:Uncharacterized protein n=1 Tax=Araneus ventricosus TaxID=182803 RepID=A0A4Y2P6K9_ARAVE|nr:hypothetical protein AVEN_122687-1 [Araneus ventricosus]